MRLRLDIDPEKVGHLLPIAALAQELGGLEIFTLNYDAALEVVSHQSGVSYTDGFDTAWNPSVFDDRDRHLLRIYKLHGSLLWYATGDAGQFEKIPLRPGTFPPEGAHISGAALESLLIYPGPQKDLHAEPYAGLMERFRAALREADVLFVMGCSMRDAHVRRTVLEMMAARPSLRMALVDPDAESLLDASDSLFPGDLLFSRFRDRIVLRASGLGEALADRAPLFMLGGCREVQAKLEELNQSKRRSGVEAQARALAEYLLTCASQQHWGPPTNLSREAAPIVLRTIQQQAGQRPAAGSPRFAIAVLAASHPNEGIRNAAREYIQTCLRQVAQYAWVHTGDGRHEIVMPEGMSVATIDKPQDDDGIRELMEQRLNAVTAARRGLQGTLVSARLFHQRRTEAAHIGA